MVILPGGGDFGLFKGAVFLGDFVGAVQLGAEVGAGLGLLHIVENTGVAVGVIVEGFENLGVELDVVIGDVVEILVEVAVRQIGEFDDLIGAFAGIGAAHPLNHGMAGVVVGVYEGTALKRVERAGGILVFVEGIGSDFAVDLALGKEHGHRHLVKAGGIVPAVFVIIPGVAGFEVAEANADAAAVGHEAVLGHKVVHHFLELCSIDNGGSCIRCRRGRDSVFSKNRHSKSNKQEER